MNNPVYGNIFRKLAQRELLTPYFEAGMLADNWPDKYNIEVDSSPYYGNGDGMFHPSSDGTAGSRFLWYKFHPEFSKLLVWPRRTLYQQMMFAMGSALHAVVQTQMKEVDIVRSDDDIEVEWINDEHNGRGRTDWITTMPSGERFPVEMKTQNPNAFRYSKPPHLKPYWKTQLNLALDNLGYNFGLVFVVERGDPFGIRELRVTRDDELLSNVYQKWDHVRERLEMDIPPKHCCTFGSQTMRECPARFVCWLADQKENVNGSRTS